MREQNLILFAYLNFNLDEIYFIFHEFGGEHN